MRSVVVLNEKAGTLQKLNGSGTAEFAEVARSAGIEAEVLDSPPGQIVETCRKAAARKPELVLVGGGDGTIGAAAGALADTGVPLGILPLGTLNHFAKDLGLPVDWREALAGIPNYGTREVDVAELNGRVFVNNCSLGPYADAVRRRDRLRRTRGYGKWRAMLVASLNVFREVRRLPLELILGGERRTVRTPFLLVSNNRYAGRLIGAPSRLRLDEGRLCVYTTRARDRWDLVRMMWRALLHRFDAVDGLDTRDGCEFSVNGLGQRPPVAADGELLSEISYPLNFRIRPRALLVRAPAPPTAA